MECRLVIRAIPSDLWLTLCLFVHTLFLLCEPKYDAPSSTVPSKSDSLQTWWNIYHNWSHWTQHADEIIYSSGIKTCQTAVICINTFTIQCENDPPQCVEMFWDWTVSVVCVLFELFPPSHFFLLLSISSFPPPPDLYSVLTRPNHFQYQPVLGPVCVCVCGPWQDPYILM